MYFWIFEFHNHTYACAVKGSVRNRSNAESFVEYSFLCHFLVDYLIILDAVGGLINNAWLLRAEFRSKH
jgi:hypothetical protein